MHSHEQENRVAGPKLSDDATYIGLVFALARHGSAAIQGDHKP